jgi:hypothetical protein
MGVAVALWDVAVILSMVQLARWAIRLYGEDGLNRTLVVVLAALIALEWGQKLFDGYPAWP